MKKRLLAVGLAVIFLPWGAPVEAVQSTITEVIGTACMGDDKSRKDTERAALADARRNAAEYAASLVQSSTEVEDFVLKEDLISAFSQARVEVLNILQKEWYDEPLVGRCYKTKIHAEVIPDEKAMQQAGRKQQMLEEDPRLPLQAKVWTDKESYKEGDKVRIFLRSNKPFYARLVYRDADNNLVQLLPNPYRSEHYFEGGVTYQVPSGKDRFDLEISPPFGQEQVMLYASTEPLGDVEVEEAGAYYVVTSSEEQVASSSRGVKIQEKLAPQAGGGKAAEFVETAVEIKVER